LGLIRVVFSVHLAKIWLEEVLQVVYYVELVVFPENSGLPENSGPTAVYLNLG